MPGSGPTVCGRASLRRLRSCPCGPCGDNQVRPADESPCDTSQDEAGRASAKVCAGSEGRSFRLVAGYPAWPNGKTKPAASLGINPKVTVRADPRQSQVYNCV